MEYRYEADTDDLYIRLRSEAVARTLEVTNGCLVDVDYKGEAVGIEVLSASRGWPVQDCHPPVAWDHPAPQTWDHLGYATTGREP